MKILYALPYVPSVIRVRPYHLIRELAAGRHDVTVLATGSERELGDLAGLRAFCRAVEVVPARVASSLKSCASAALTGEPLQAAYCRSPQLTHRFDELINTGEFDVVHVEHLRAAHLGLRSSPSVPTVFDAVDCISLLQHRTLRASHSLRQRLLAALELRRTRRYEARLLRQFGSVVATSPEDARALEALAPGSRVTVVPNGVDMERFSPARGPVDRATLVFSGKMSYHANVTAVMHFVHEVLPRLRESHPDVRLKIVGANPPPAIKALAVNPAITVTGYVPDMRDALGAATIAICPVTVKVGLQNKVLEAMAMGIPVVATRLGADGLQATRGRDLLVADDPADFATHVTRLLADEGLRAAVGAAGRRYVEQNHRWASAAQRLENVYLTAPNRKPLTRELNSFATPTQFLSRDARR